MDQKFFAKEISVKTEEQTLTIQWGDGHITTFGLDGLRKACPCAECAGGHANMGKAIDPAIFKQLSSRFWKITNLTEVGYYALQIHWDDGHSTGIYTWRKLREWCPCDACQT